MSISLNSNNSNEKYQTELANQRKLKIMKLKKKI